MESISEQAIKKYCKWSTVFSWILVLLWLISCIWVRGLAAVVLLFVVLIVHKVIISRVALKTLMPVLFDKLDAVEFQKIVNDKRFIAPIIYQLGSAIPAGDYQTAVNIAVKCLSDKKTKLKDKYYYLRVLGRVYFELRDFEKLNIVLSKYKEYNALNPSGKLSNEENFKWMYYQYFLEKNYDECKKITSDRIKNVNSNKLYSKITKMQNDFFYAVLCYENKEFEEAERVFKSIVSYAPKMHLSVISEKYLDSIAQNSEFPSVIEEVVPDPDFQIYDSKTISKTKRNKLIIVIILIVVVILEIAGLIFSHF